MGMEWFRQQRHFLLRFSLALWLLVLLVTAGQAWLQHCANAAVAIGPSLQLPGLQLCSWLWLLLLPALAQFKPAKNASCAFLAQRRRVAPGPPARLRFVRFND